jgi:hypothetical protein
MARQLVKQNYQERDVIMSMRMKTEYLELSGLSLKNQIIIQIKLIHMHLMVR